MECPVISIRGVTHLMMCKMYILFISILKSYHVCVVNDFSELYNLLVWVQSTKQ